MKLNLRVTPATIELIKRYEGLRERAARRSDGVWVIGYGHTRFARDGAQVNEKDAEALLVYDLMQISTALEKVIETPLNAHQFDALAAFAFDIGVEDFRKSEVLRWVNDGALLQAAAALAAWRPPQDGRDRPSLDETLRRRADEKALFLRPVEDEGAFRLAVQRPAVIETAPEPLRAAIPVAPAPAPIPVAPAPVVVEPAPPVAAAVSAPEPPSLPPASPPSVEPVETRAPHPVIPSEDPPIRQAAPPVKMVETAQPSETAAPSRPVSPVTPTVEPLVRRAAPPAPAPAIPVIGTEPAPTLSILVPEPTPAPSLTPVIASVEASPRPAPPAASTDVSHYDALLLALESPRPQAAHPEALPSFELAVAPEPVIPPPPPQPPQELQSPPAPALHEPVERLIVSQPVFVLGDAPANDHPIITSAPAAPADPASAAAPDAPRTPVAEPEPAAPVLPVLTDSPPAVIAVRPEAPPPPPPPLKRWTPPPRPPRPDRALTPMAAPESVAVATAAHPVAAPEPEAPVMAPSPPLATVTDETAPTSASFNPPRAAEAVATLASPVVEVERAEVIAPPVTEADRSPAPAAEPGVESPSPQSSPRRRPFFEASPSRATTPQPEKAREPVTLRLGALPYLLLGLLGVMLFTGALVSMFRQANIANLLAGLAGVAFMAPSAGHFLLAAVSGQRSPTSSSV